MKYHSEDLSQYKFLVTGGAGFIGSNIVKYLVAHNAGEIRIVDNLSNGYIENIEPFLTLPNVLFIKESLVDFELCQKVVKGVDYVIHQAALGSVPRSINNPIASNEANVTGFLNLLTAAKDEKVKRLVFASSSSVYGDSDEMPRRENVLGNPLSPYAVTKRTDELYGRVFHLTYNAPFIGLRYFNVFGPHQSPNGPYAAVIPMFMNALLSGQSPVIHGEGDQSRDFTYIDNVVQANIKALFTKDERANGEMFNIAFGESTSVLDLFKMLKAAVSSDLEPTFTAPRAGDVKDSLADISKARELLGYNPTITINTGLTQTIQWFEQKYFKK
ncbi:MAG: SDR family oxidoreductase [Bacteroidetes bacterium]|nr:SDR family oxidoreductase [Bacteroidota bacterium]